MSITEAACSIRQRLIDGGFDEERAELMAHDAFRALCYDEGNARDLLDKTEAPSKAVA